MYRKYLKQSALLFVISMLCVAIINIIVDPGEIYLKKIIGEKKSQEFAHELFRSDNGVIQTGWNERLIKVTLAEFSGDFECIILGSSRVMQISSLRDTGSIKTNCTSLLNLGVSGGGIEDVSIFSYLILNNSKLPTKIFIGVDPWTLKFNMDSRYGAYNHIYEKMNVLLNEQKLNGNLTYSQKVLSNLFNGKYLYQSIRLLIKSEKNSIFMKKIQYPTEKFSHLIGYAETVTLADGSHVYAKSWIEEQKSKKVELGGGEYKISGMPYDPAALAYLKKLIEMLQKNKIQVELVMIPYHPNVFKLEQTKAVKYIESIDSIVKEFAEENNLKYHGSFMPDKFGCTNVEFYDFMHPTNACLNKINFGA